MKIRIYQDDDRKPWAREWCNAFFEGAKAHKLDVGWGDLEMKDETPDLAVIWGVNWKAVTARQKEEGKDFLVMERGFIGDRQKFTSLGFNGLNGRAEWELPTRHDETDRADLHGFYDEYMSRNWGDEEGYLLICGQVPNDNSVKGVDLDAFYQLRANDAIGHKMPVVFRPHPESLTAYVIPTPTGAARSTNASLDDDLKSAAVCYAYNSNSLVEAFLSGVHTCVEDHDGAMTRLMSKDAIALGFGRQVFLHNLAYCQWAMDEIGNGDAWAHIGRRYQ